MKGYPDLIINNHHAKYSGFAIELKSPTGGKLSENQREMMRKYQQNKFKTLVSDNYDEIIVALIRYMDDVRICCHYCCKKFKTEESLRQHISKFHKL